MAYRFATEDQDFRDFSGGRVIYSQPGFPAFPVRLVSEIFQRALFVFERQPRPAPARLRLYDPVCGGAYHLAALGFLHGARIEAILASDANPQALALAERNLGLLSMAGLAQREREIEHMLAAYGKESHAEALRSLATLKQQLDPAQPIRTRVFQANALDGAELAGGLVGESIDLVISDIPYGLQSSWIMPGEPGQADSPPLERMLSALHPLLRPGALLAIAADKAQKIRHPAYQRVEQFQVGKRQVAFLQLAAPLAQ